MLLYEKTIKANALYLALCNEVFTIIYILSGSHTSFPVFYIFALVSTLRFLVLVCCRWWSPGCAPSATRWVTATPFASWGSAPPLPMPKTWASGLGPLPMASTTSHLVHFQCKPNALQPWPFSSCDCAITCILSCAVSLILAVCLTWLPSMLPP